MGYEWYGSKGATILIAKISIKVLTLIDQLVPEFL